MYEKIVSTLITEDKDKLKAYVDEAIMLDPAMEDYKTHRLPCVGVTLESSALVSIRCEPILGAIGQPQYWKVQVSYYFNGATPLIVKQT